MPSKYTLFGTPIGTVSSNTPISNNYEQWINFFPTHQDAEKDLAFKKLYESYIFNNRIPPKPKIEYKEDEWE